MTMPGDAGFTVTPQYIQYAAQSAKSTSDNITDQLSTLRGFVTSLEDQWQGIAANTFSALMADYDIYSQMLNQALTGIASGLNGTYVNYVDSEEQNISNLQQVNGSIPGANFS